MRIIAYQRHINRKRGISVRQKIHLHVYCTFNACDETVKISLYVDIRCYNETE